MTEPIRLIEKELKYKKESLEVLNKKLNDEKNQISSITGDIQALKEKIRVFEEAIALLMEEEK
ncbi:hypothetical protein ES703_86370 [subsurface metagenome]